MSKSGGFLLGAIIGGTAAAVTALLFAPKSGKELREDLAKEADRYKEHFSEYTEIALAKGAELTEVAKTSTQDIRVNLKEQASNLKEQVSKQAGNLKEQFTAQSENLKEQVTSTVGKVKGNFFKAKEDSAEVVADLAEDVKESAEEAKA